MSESRPVYGDAPNFAIRQLDIDLSDTEALTLSQFINRLGWSEFRSNAVDDDEAHRIKNAVSRLQSALAREGYV